MNVTADEAKTKWCPFKRVALSAGMVANYTINMNFDDSGADYKTTRCLADECMAWRWYSYERMFGHCGLAGEPIYREK